MKKIKFENLGVSELTHHETVIIEGGSWLSRVWDQLVTGVIDGWNELQQFFK